MTRIVAVDTGGTFTDLVSYEFESKKFAFSKSLTTYNNLVEGISACLDKSGTGLDTATFFKHGTTVVINTLLERSGGPIALITTRGFRDVIELGRGNRPDVFNLFYRRHPALIPRNMRFEIGERTDGQGNLIRVPMREEVKAVAETIRATGGRVIWGTFISLVGALALSVSTDIVLHSIALPAAAVS